MNRTSACHPKAHRYRCALAWVLDTHVTLCAENFQSPELNKSRNSDCSVSRGTNSKWDFGWIWICTVKFEILDLVDFSGVEFSVETVIWISHMTSCHTCKCTMLHILVDHRHITKMWRLPLVCLLCERNVHVYYMNWFLSEYPTHPSIHPSVHMYWCALYVSGMYIFITWTDFYLSTPPIPVSIPLYIYIVYTCYYGVAMMSRLLKITGLFCKRALQKRRYSARETYNLKELSNRSHPIPHCPWSFLVALSSPLSRCPSSCMYPLSHEWVMSHIWTSHVKHTNESCHTYKSKIQHITKMLIMHLCRYTHIWLSHMNASRQSFEWVMPPIWMRRVTHTPSSFHLFTQCHLMMCHVTRSYVWYDTTRTPLTCSRVPICATHCNTLQHTATHCNTLQHTATHCNTLQTRCNTLQHTATHCNTLQHTTPHGNTLHHTATHCITLQHTAPDCTTLQHIAIHCNTLQHTATHCNALQWDKTRAPLTHSLIPISASHLQHTATCQGTNNLDMFVCL